MQRVSSRVRATAPHSIRRLLVGSVLVWITAVGPAVATTFIRGDANLDDLVDMSDPIALLQHLFSGPAVDGISRCADAADANDDGLLSIADAVSILGLLFRGDRSLAAPFPEPGTDPTVDELACEEDDDSPLRDGFPHPSEDALEEITSLLELRSASASRAGGDPHRAEPPELGGGGDEPGDEEEDPAPAGGDGADDTGDVLVVDAETFDVLESLPPGASILDVPGGEEILSLLRGPDRAPGAPRALTSRLVVPVSSPDECWTVESAFVDGGSFDPDAPELEFVRGDVDGDGDVDPEDLDLMGQCVADSTLEVCSRVCPDAWDVDDDGEVGRADAVALARVVSRYDDRPAPAPDLCDGDSTPDGLAACERSGCGRRVSQLRFEVWPRTLCGVGTHEVLLTVTDPDGNTDTAPALVTLCAAGADNCPDTLVRVPARGETEYDFLCAWVLSIFMRPNPPERELIQTSYSGSGSLERVRREAPLDGLGSSTVCSKISGPGPAHYLFATRRNASCRMPRTATGKVADGLVEVRVHLLCADERGTIQGRECSAEVEAEGLYRSHLMAETVAGDRCAGRPAAVEALSKDETRFVVDESIVFAQGASVQTGTRVTETPTFTLAVGQPAGQPVPGVNMTMGISRTVIDATGRVDDILAAFGARRTRPPTTLVLESKGSARVVGNDRSAGRAITSTRAAALWLAATTSCPGAGHFGLGVLIGTPDGLAEAGARARGFFLTRLGRPARR